MSRVTASLGTKDSRAGLKLVAILVAVSLVIITIYSREGSSGPIHLVRSAVQTLATPFRIAGSQLSRPFDALGTIVSNATATSESLSELQEENSALIQQLAQFNEYKLENDRLNAILSLSNSYSLQGVAARVIARSDDEWSDTLTIDKGSNDGVVIDMPVTSGSAVIGQVTAVSATSSTVRLLSDPSMQISVMLQNSRATGILTGSLDGSLHLLYITSDVEVSLGDLVVTSGLGGVYPKGLLVGRVVATSSVASGQYRDITVQAEPQVDNYEEVLVVFSFDDSLDNADTATQDTESGGQA